VTPIIKSAEDMQKALDHYFAETETPTVAGMAYYLGYTDRQSIYDLKGRDESYSCIIKRAVLRIEAVHEANLSTRDKPVGDIFWLKNHGWKDKQEVDLTAGPLEIKVSHETKGI
jgi:hypothetical protein